MAVSYIPTYHNLSVTPLGLGTFNINYVKAGSPNLPTVLLLHGFPSSSTQFRDFVPLLSNDYHVLAPDLPGFGLTKSPRDLKYTFDNLAKAISAWLVALNVTSYAVYMFDYGAPVAQRLALENPVQVKAMITQNGNAYDVGFGHPFWSPIEALWQSNNSAEDREWLRDNYLTIAGTKMQYVTGVPKEDLPLINPAAWTSDYLMNVAGKENEEHQLDLFFDYRNNKVIYPKIHEYFRNTQVPLLAVWGKNDPVFEHAEAYKQDLPNAEVRLLDAGHFALETKRWEIARIMVAFLKKIDF